MCARADASLAPGGLLTQSLITVQNLEFEITFKLHYYKCVQSKDSWWERVREGSRH